MIWIPRIELKSKGRWRDNSVQARDEESRCWDKIAFINKIYRDGFYNDILTKSDNIKKKDVDNINLLINNKRPSSHIEKLQVENKMNANNLLPSPTASINFSVMSLLHYLIGVQHLIFPRNKKHFASHKCLQYRYFYCYKVLIRRNHLGLTRLIHFY